MDLCKLRESLFQQHQSLLLLKKNSLTSNIAEQKVLDMEKGIRNLKESVNPLLVFHFHNFNEFLSFMRDFSFLEIDINSRLKRLESAVVGEAFYFEDAELDGEVYKKIFTELRSLRTFWSQISTELESIQSSCDNDSEVDKLQLRIRLEELKRCKDEISELVCFPNLANDEANTGFDRIYEMLKARLPEVDATELEQMIDLNCLPRQDFKIFGSIPLLVDQLKKILDEMEAEEKLSSFSYCHCQDLKVTLTSWVDRRNKLMAYLSLAALLSRDGTKVVLKFQKEVSIMDNKFILLASKVADIDDIRRKIQLDTISEVKSSLAKLMEEATNLDSSMRRLSLLDWLKENPQGTAEWKALQETREMVVHTAIELSGLLVRFLRLSHAEWIKKDLMVKFQSLSSVVAKKLLFLMDRIDLVDDFTLDNGSSELCEEGNNIIIHSFIEAILHLDAVLSCPSLPEGSKSSIAEVNLRMRDSLGRCLLLMRKVKIMMNVKHDSVTFDLWKDMDMDEGQS